MALDKARELVKAVGARPFEIDAAQHDRITAAISHLPFLVASNLVDVVDEWAEGDEQVASLGASGFRDTTRLAASDTQMMLDILLTNRENLGELMRLYARKWEELSELVEDPNENELRELLERIAGRRKEL